MKPERCVGGHWVLPEAWLYCWWRTPFEGKKKTKLSVSSRHAEPRERSENVMSKFVRRTLADTPMTPARRRKLARLAAQPDSKIKFSEIPPLKESFWKNAVRNPFYRPVKQQLTVRLDADLVAWLRRPGKGYQTRLNRLLRKAMLEDIEKSA